MTRAGKAVRVSKRSIEDIVDYLCEVGRHVEIFYANSLHDRIRKLAEAEGVSINQFIATAVAEKTAALMTDEYLAQRAGRSSSDKFRKALEGIPDRPADPGDEVPPEGGY